MLVGDLRDPNPDRMNHGNTQARPRHASDSLELARLLGIWRMLYASQPPLVVTAQAGTTDTL